MKTTLTLLCIVSVAASAHAVPTLNLMGTGKGTNTRISIDSGSTFDGVFAGEMKLRLDTGAGTTDFRGFCTDADLRVASGAWGIQILDTNSLSPNGDRIGYLVNKYLPGISLSGTNAEARALQLTIWELSEETSGIYGLTDGTFRAKEMNGDPLNATTLNWVNTYLNDVGSSVAPFYASNLDGNNRQLSQNMVTAVPEPATLAALGFGAAALLRRKRRA